MPKQALGRGLSALLTKRDDDVDNASDPVPTPVSQSGNEPDRIHSVPLNRLVQSRLQPRTVFPEDALKDLADSIREQGILQPLIVRPSKDNKLELIAGERRWRAATLAGLDRVPVIVREADDPTVLEMMLIENLQREGLNPIEEALGYSRLIEEFQLRQEDVAQKVGKSRTVVANALRLLKLPDSIRNWVRDGFLSVGNAKVILGLPSHEEQQLAARKVLEQHLSVRETEQLVANLQGQSNRPGNARSGTPKENGSAAQSSVRDLQDKLKQHFGTRVNLKYKEGKGTLEIRFFSDTDLERILELCGVKPD